MSVENDEGIVIRPRLGSYVNRFDSLSINISSLRDDYLETHIISAGFPDCQQIMLALNSY
jgi:hypothetical protein